MHTNSNIKLFLLREKKRFFKSVFLVSNILPRGLIALLTKNYHKNPDPIFDPAGDVFGQKKGVVGVSWREVLAQMFP